MKHKTWFRLVLQAIGVLLVGLAIPSFMQSIGTYVLWRWIMPGAGAAGWGGGSAWDEFLAIAIQGLPSIAQIAFGIYLMTGASWLLNKIIPSNRPYCPECGYDLSHNSGPKCAECGVTLPRTTAQETAEQAD